MSDYYDHPLPKKGDLIRITDVHSQRGNSTFQAGDLVEVSSAWQDKDSGIIHFRAKVRGRKKSQLYSSMTYDWEIFGKEVETIMEAQEKTLEFVKKTSEGRFEEIWENWRKNEVFPQEVFQSATMKRMFALVFYSAFEDGWNACCANSMDDHMREIELCLGEIAKLSDVYIKEAKQ